jgi:hypothetical protein
MIVITSPIMEGLKNKKKDKNKKDKNKKDKNKNDKNKNDKKSKTLTSEQCNYQFNMSTELSETERYSNYFKCMKRN